MSMTHPLAALIAGVKVKPLVWEGDETDLHDLIARPDPFHTYTVRPLGELRFDVILNHELGSLWFRQRKGEIWPDYASAKAAAQADYEARILAALEAATPPDLVVVVNKVTAIVEDWESQAGERDPRDPIKSQIYEEASAIRALIALATAQAAQIAGLTKALETKDANRRFIIDERDRTFSLMVKRAEAAEAKVAEYESEDGMKGAIVHAIRLLLNSHNVPAAAFIDDHVCNAIAQRDAAEAEAATLRAEVERLRGALSLIALAKDLESPSEYNRGWNASRSRMREIARAAMEGKHE